MYISMCVYLHMVLYKYIQIILHIHPSIQDCRIAGLHMYVCMYECMRLAFQELVARAIKWQQTTV